MQVLNGSLWDYRGERDYTVITCNCVICSYGLVIGRGCALQARQRFPSLPRIFSKLVTHRTSFMVYHPYRLVACCTKHDWQQPADPKLIRHSYTQLNKYAHAHPELRFFTTLPGSGNGWLEQSDSWKLLREIIDAENISIICPRKR